MVVDGAAGLVLARGATVGEGREIFSGAGSGVGGATTSLGIAGNETIEGALLAPAVLDRGFVSVVTSTNEAAGVGKTSIFETCDNRIPAVAITTA
ncbi:MAG: hypothetical protein QM760_11860 [Nibricoccus sp.]